jgi:hypothetical protein
MKSNDTEYDREYDREYDTDDSDKKIVSVKEQNINDLLTRAITLANTDIEKIVFNRAERPITRTNLSPQQIKPIILYLDNLFDNISEKTISIENIDNVIKEDAESDNKVIFLCDISYFDKDYKLFVEILSTRMLIDDIIMNTYNNRINQIYINKLELFSGNKIETLNFHILDE